MTEGPVLLEVLLDLAHAAKLHVVADGCSSPELEEALLKLEAVVLGNA